jgi:hypothetical protein
VHFSHETIAAAFCTQTGTHTINFGRRPISNLSWLGVNDLQLLSATRAENEQASIPPPGNHVRGSTIETTGLRPFFEKLVVSVDVICMIFLSAGTLYGCSLSVSLVPIRLVVVHNFSPFMNVIFFGFEIEFFIIRRPIFLHYSWEGSFIDKKQKILRRRQNCFNTKTARLLYHLK